MRTKLLFFFIFVGVLLIILGLVLGIQPSIHYKDIAFIPLALGVTILILLAFIEVGRGKVDYGFLSVLLAFVIAMIILGLIIPLMYG